MIGTWIDRGGSVIHAANEKEDMTLCGKKIDDRWIVGTLANVSFVGCKKCKRALEGGAE